MSCLRHGDQAGGSKPRKRCGRGAESAAWVQDMWGQLNSKHLHSSVGRKVTLDRPYKRCEASSCHRAWCGGSAFDRRVVLLSPERRWSPSLLPLWRHHSQEPVSPGRGPVGLLWAMVLFRPSSSEVPHLEPSLQAYQGSWQRCSHSSVQ